MHAKKASLDLTGLVMVIIIVAVILLLLATNNLYFAKPTFEGNSEKSYSSEEAVSSEYGSILKHTERTVDTLKEQLSSQEMQINN